MTNNNTTNTLNTPRKPHKARIVHTFSSGSYTVPPQVQVAQPMPQRAAPTLLADSSFANSTIFDRPIDRLIKMADISLRSEYTLRLDAISSKKTLSAFKNPCNWKDPTSAAKLKKVTALVVTPMGCPTLVDKINSLDLSKINPFQYIKILDLSSINMLPKFVNAPKVLELLKLLAQPNSPFTSLETLLLGPIEGSTPFELPHDLPVKNLKFSSLLKNANLIIPRLPNLETLCFSTIEENAKVTASPEYLLSPPKNIRALEFLGASFDTSTFWTFSDIPHFPNIFFHDIPFSQAEIKFPGSENATGLVSVNPCIDKETCVHFPNADVTFSFFDEQTVVKFKNGKAALYV